MKCIHNDGFIIEDRNELRKFEDLCFSGYMKYGNIIDIKVKCNSLECSYEKKIRIEITEVIQ